MSINNGSSSSGHATMTGPGRTGGGGGISPFGGMSVTNGAALTALNANSFTTGTIVRVQSYKDEFILDKVTIRTAIPNEVIASTSPTAWWVRLEIKDPYWEIQPTWYIDPVNGNDENEGDIAGAGNALKTRAEYARRTDGTQLRSNVTITIASSLGATDIRIPHRMQTGVSINGVPRFIILYQGVKTLLFTGVITALTNRNGATSQQTLMTIAGIPVSWTASGLVGKIVEYDDGVGGFVRSTVVRDQGAKQAWLSPPLNTVYSQGATFTNGTTVRVYDCPSLSTTNAQTINYDYVEYDYLSASVWEFFGSYNQFTNCLGAFATYGGTSNLLNCAFSSVSILDGVVNLSGGQSHYTVGIGAALRVNGHATITGPTGLSVAGSFATPGQSANNLADIEFAAVTTPISMSTVAGGQAHFSQYCYGTLSAGTIVVNFTLGARDGLVNFAQLPVLGVAGQVVFDDVAWNGLVANLATAEIADDNNNRVIGPKGQTYNDDNLILRIAQGIIAETCPRSHTLAGTVMVNGSIYFDAIPLKVGDLVTNITIVILAAGTLITLSKVGLYDKAGNLLASSADQGVSWQTAGLKTIAMGATFRVLTTDQYYIAAICTFTGVGPNIVRSSTGAGVPLLNTAIGAGSLPWGIQTGQTDLINPATIAVGTVALAIWGAVS